MSKKLAKVLILSLIGLFGLVTSAFSVPSLPYYLSYTTDPVGNPDDQSPFADILFELRVSENGSALYPYHAEFTITAPDPAVPPPLYSIGWFVLQFDASTPADINLGSLTVPLNTGSWGILTSSTALPWGGGTISPANAGKSGLYLMSMPDSQSDSWTNMGVLVNSGGPYTFEFDFNEPSPLADTVNFQVGFYSDVWQRIGGPSSTRGFYKHTQLSSTLIPEPSTLLLLGAGLVGFGILARRKFRS